MSQHTRLARHVQPLERRLRWLVCLALIVGWLQPAAALARDPDQTNLPVRPVATEEPAVVHAPEAPEAPEAVGIVVTKADQLSFDPDSDGLADVNDGIRYTVGITNSGDTDATGVNFNDTVDTLTTLVPGSTRVTPLARDDAFAAIGNTMLHVGVAKPAGTVGKEIAGNLFGNDSEFLGDTFALQTFDATSANGGTVVVNANGSFSYLPPVGFTGTDTFTYTIADPGGLIGKGTVTITVAERVWYVDNALGTNGNGRSNSPFNTITSAQTASGVNDYIFLHTGSGNYGAITLKNGQQLIGRGVDLIVSGFTLLAAGTAPTISAAGTLVTLAQNNTVRGMNINSQAAGLGISGTNFGTATINTVAMNGGPALTLTTGTLNGSFATLTSA
ncbi:MAG TPA: Ig-like domain-containing protein, partial [Herpetosiphonaceae bacterium]|nr:Ig-like domain-containing protein [Herpetosiphonaceae bacterium]